MKVFSSTHAVLDSLIITAAAIGLPPNGHAAKAQMCTPHFHHKANAVPAWSRKGDLKQVVLKCSQNLEREQEGGRQLRVVMNKAQLATATTQEIYRNSFLGGWLRGVDLNHHRPLITHNLLILNVHNSSNEQQVRLVNTI